MISFINTAVLEFPEASCVLLKRKLFPLDVDFDSDDDKNFSIEEHQDIAAFLFSLYPIDISKGMLYTNWKYFTTFTAISILVVNKNSVYLSVKIFLNLNKVLDYSTILFNVSSPFSLIQHYSKHSGKLKKYFK